MITPTQQEITPEGALTELDNPVVKRKSILVRIASGLPIFLFFIWILFATYSGLPFALGVAIVSIIGASEFYRAVRNQDAEPAEFLGYLACIVFQFGAWARHGETFTGYLTAVLIILVLLTLLYELIKKRPRPIANVGTTLLGAIYVGWLFSYLTLLRNVQTPVLTPPVAGTAIGAWLVIFVGVSTWLSDTGAYFTGIFLGRNKMAPSISPAKTWEGSIGGLIVSLVGGVTLGYWLKIPVIHAFSLALLCGIMGQIGDLCESALKRDLGVKDFGHWIPGHGGILDRIDSILFTAPLAYYYVIFFLR